MNRLARLRCLLALSLTASLYAGVGAAQSFGTKAYTITKVPAAAFTGATFLISSSLARFGSLNVDQHFYATLDIPLGVVIDYIGLNNLNSGTPFAIGASLWVRSATGQTNNVAAVACSAHIGFATDIGGPIGLVHNVDADTVLILDVEIPASPSIEYFGWVEVWWHRTVSNGPLTAHFSDVPTTHPLFKFVEALYAAGITAGYPDGRYGVNDPITRGQMAVYLSVALGLQFGD